MNNAWFVVGTLLQAIAVAYGFYLLTRQKSAAGAWLFLLGAMVSMLTWRIVGLLRIDAPAFFNPMIAIWGSSCMMAAMFLFGREVHRREQAEKQRDALLESERAARIEAEQANRVKDDFIATLSHELRNPLAAILGWVSVARARRNKPDDLQNAFDTIERNARAQAHLVEDLLDITRLQAGTLHVEFAPVALDVPVRAAIQTVEPRAAAKSIGIDYVQSDEAPWVSGDAQRLQQVVSNLLVNAVKFTPPGGSISLQLSSADGHAVLTVRDTGEGIAPEFLPHLFTRFRQADRGAARRHGGLGLGLSIVDNLLRLHGGSVSAQSDGQDRGSTFTVRLPLAKPERSDIAQQMPGTSTQMTLQHVRILLIDDDADIRRAVSELLKDLGAEVACLESGEHVASHLVEYRPDILLIDIGMPGEDGYSLIERIRRLPASSGGATPAISLTAHAREEDRAKALTAGFQSHLAKPIDLPLLVASIRTHIAAAESAA